MAIVAPIQRAVDRPPQASSSGREPSPCVVSSELSTLNPQVLAAHLLYTTPAPHVHARSSPHTSHGTYQRTLTSPREADELLGRPQQQQELPASRRAACARCRTGSWATMRPTHLLNDQVTVPNVPSESGRATSDELVIIFKLVTFFKKYSSPNASQSTIQNDFIALNPIRVIADDRSGAA